MKEHPIPQDITNYRFHIVGSMTLKQFGEAALGVVLALIIYKTNLFVFVKWPLIALFVGGGFAAAFLPIEERPISHWLSTFFSILYKPTQFFWKREYNIPEPFLYVANQHQQEYVKELDLTPARRQRIKEFLSTTTDGRSEFYTPDEQNYMDSVMSLFQTEVVPQTLSATTRQHVLVEKPNLTVRMRSMRATTVFESIDPSADRISINSLDDSDTGTYLLNTAFADHQSSDKKNVYLETTQVAQQLQVPENIAVQIERPKETEELEVLRHQQSQNLDERSFIEKQQAPVAVTTTQSVRFNSELPFPTAPSVPNKLVGMILTPSNDLVPGAIIEIKTIEGRVSRAVKSNALGQFFITTPLPDGEYIVTAEKDGLVFSPQAITLTGKIVAPIEIRSH